MGCGSRAPIKQLDNGRLASAALLRSQSQQAALALFFLGYRQKMFAFETQMIIA
jgi:hypothetical protein